MEKPIGKKKNHWGQGNIPDFITQLGRESFQICVHNKTFSYVTVSLKKVSRLANSFYSKETFSYISHSHLKSNSQHLVMKHNHVFLTSIGK